MGSLPKTSVLKLVYIIEEKSLWYKTAKENGVLELLLKEEIPTTNFQIDFAQFLINEPSKLGFYNEHKAFLNYTSRT